MNCPKCDEQVAIYGNTIHCNCCGYKGKLKQLRCPSCGSRQNVEARFGKKVYCNNCGYDGKRWKEFARNIKDLN